MRRSTHPVIGVGTLNLDPRARELVNQVLLNNRLSYGPMSRKFESEFAQAHGTRFGVMSNSGTSSLLVALQTLKELHAWEDGDEVLVPAVTFVATANVVLHNNLTPVFVDVERDFYGIDIERLEAAITRRTRAIIPVHLFGMPCEMDGVRTLAQEHNLKVLEDSCETMFATYKDQPVGSLGDIACFSTYVAHLLVTGVGGVSLTDNPDYAVCMRSLINHGRDSIYLSIDDDNELKSDEELQMVVARRFNFVRCGHSFRATEMEAALGVAALESADKMIARRRSNGAFLTRELARFEDRLQLPRIRPQCQHSFMMYPLVVRQEAKHDLVNFLEQRGVETRDFLPVINQPVYSQRINQDDFPVAKWLHQSGFYIGCHQDLNVIDLGYIVELFERYFRPSRAPKTQQGSALVLVVEGEVDLDDIVDNLPRELFNKILAIDQSGSAAVSEALEQAEIERFSGSGSVLDILSRDEIDLPFENLVLFPATGRFDVFDISRVLLTLERGYDMVIASRFMLGGQRHGEKPGRYRSVGNRVFNFLASLIFEGNISDGMSPFRGIKRSRLTELKLRRSSHPGFYQLSIQGLKRNWQISEVPTTELVRMNLEQMMKIATSVPQVLQVLVSEAVSRPST